ncbi:Sphingoid long-chain base transporter RSB1 [Fusarium oxysporum f. sp. cubense race 1]|uniref:Sphingoid long-chain base transporter RSB1 n=1 Tax=Fusarium oxysporum f. sp. cubense (strain race 1) TaxID=1229664 RepID=N4TZR1_FUSC1|nr:Sphingoid long-chain base transporter RSB1 [Fusarium oxysporum f. sp. cubense race 1]
MSTTTFTSTATTTSSATATCTTAVPGKYGRVPVDACNANYFFDPSFAANLAFCVLFGMTTMVHLIQAILFKKKFCWVAIMGATWETIGFAFKTLGSRNQQNMTYLIWGQLFFLLAPLWINAFVYMAVARMVYFRMPDRKLLGIKAIRMTLLFVWLDIILFLVQGAGGSMLSNNDDMNVIRIGQKLYMAGVGLQLAVIVIFIGITAFFYFKLRQLEGRSMGRMKWLILTMLAVLILIVIRIVYRLIEFGPGVNEHNQLLIHEEYPLGLDATPILIALVLLNIMHPGFVLRGPDSEFPKLSRKEKKALKQQKKMENKQAKEAKKARKAGAQELKNLSYEGQSNSSNELV